MSVERCCYVCNNPDEETRPYGAGGKPICFPCMKAAPEREAEAKRQLLGQVAAAGGGAVLFDGERGLRPLARGRGRQ